MVQAARPKLTGWAAAASAKEMGSSTTSSGVSGGSGHHNHNTTQSQHYPLHSATEGQTIPSGTAHSASGAGTPAASNHINASGTKDDDSGANEVKDSKKSRKPQRAPFNAQEVDTFLRSHFKQHVQSATSYGSSSRSDTWDTNTSSKWKSKRYGCLNEIAKALRS
ncbi:HBL380Wp [Eremothecium sinecaudum]|uniref:HBL380Wp n=1 Tax=Eremothecium sinecaudum TaxID=45286 RepID=A0A109UWB1_9SACH|nr:HBL380Wp [Eremothecium sinecaudum]AMD18522.1 HBL380Wp [Eremothecium sinecaudum]